MESYGIYSIPGKIAALVPEYKVRPVFGRTAAYVPALAVKDCPWAEHFDDDYDDDDDYIYDNF